MIVQHCARCCHPAAPAAPGVYSALLPPGGAVLELCASRHSHLPPGLALSRVAGQGLNSQELAGNTALGEWWVQVSAAPGGCMRWWFLWQAATMQCCIVLLQCPVLQAN